MRNLYALFFATARRTLGWMSAAVAAMLAFGMYLQYGLGLQPCPMCVVQRYAYVLIALLALLGAALPWRRAHVLALALVCCAALAGAFVAARQSWLQWYPPASYGCGRDFYGIIEHMPLSQALPRIFSGNGSCTAVEWTLLGGSIANWSFVCFVCLTLVCAAWLWTLLRPQKSSA